MESLQTYKQNQFKKWNFCSLVYRFGVFVSHLDTDNVEFMRVTDVSIASSTLARMKSRSGKNVHHH